MDRRGFLTGGFLKPLLGALESRLPKASTPPPRLGYPRRAPPPLRPPGAIAEVDFLRDCTRCSDCIAACPHHAIRIADARWGMAAETPIIDPVADPCLQCPDTPCISACAPRALRRAADAPMPVMGTARIDPFSCIAHLGTTCSACHERCPVSGAISVTDGKPRIDAQVCTGCGVCANVCPAPRNAVAILPAIRSTHE